MSDAASTHLLDAAVVAEGLHAVRVGRGIIILPEIDSTNSHAMALLERDPEGSKYDGIVILAEHQTAGRGRLGRKWHSTRGAGLNMTVALIEPANDFRHARWMMTAAVAAVEGISRSTDVEPTIRWPNDLYVANRKLAGILIETRPLAGGRLGIALGIGVNCLQQPGHFPSDLGDHATSLEIESSHAVHRSAVAREILRALDENLAKSSPTRDTDLAAAWREHSSDIGAHATLVEDGRTCSGRILDVDPVAGLLVQLDAGGRRHFDASRTSRIG